MSADPKPSNNRHTSVSGLVKQDAKLTVKNVAHSVGLISSPNKIMTRQLKLRPFDSTHVWVCKRKEYLLAWCSILYFC